MYNGVQNKMYYVFWTVSFVHDHIDLRVFWLFLLFYSSYYSNKLFFPNIIRLCNTDVQIRPNLRFIVYVCICPIQIFNIWNSDRIINKRNLPWIEVTQGTGDYCIEIPLESFMI